MFGTAAGGLCIRGAFAKRACRFGLEGLLWMHGRLGVRGCHGGMMWHDGWYRLELMAPVATDGEVGLMG